jgi:hypothetical protein
MMGGMGGWGDFGSLGVVGGLIGMLAKNIADKSLCRLKMPGQRSRATCSGSGTQIFGSVRS